MPSNVESLPPYPSGWHPWYPFTRVNTLNTEREYYFPPDMLPSTKFGVVNEYDNLSIQIPNEDFSLLYVGGGTMASSFIFGGMLNSPTNLVITLSRKQSWMAAGMNTTAMLMPSPRFGFSIGGHFKHQAYIKLTVYGSGAVGTGYNVIWLAAAGVPQIEFTTNSRLTKFIVHHGKVTDLIKQHVEKTDVEPAEDNLMVKLFDNEFSSSFASAPSGKITFYGLRSDGYQSKVFDYTDVDKDWYMKMKDPSIADKNAFMPNVGDFYILDKPMMCDDPQLMHEFNLKLDPGGMYMTKEQRWSVDNQGIGLWIFNEPGSNYAAYVNPDDQHRVNLPSSQPQAEWVEESTDFGGSFVDGVDNWEKTVPKLTTVRLIVGAQGGMPTQNYFSNNLSGEYICVKGTAGNEGETPSADEWYEIVGHPRLDTIEINNTGVTSGKSFMDSPAAKFVTYQQKFWKITELYSGSGGVSGALWGGSVTSMKQSGTDNAYEVNWTANEFEAFLFLPESEIKKNGASTLPERFRTKCPLVATAINGYDKYAGWLATIGGSEYKIRSTTFKVGQNSKVTVKAVVEGNPTAYSGPGSLIYVTFGERYKSPFGGDLAANTFANIEVAIAKTTDLTATHASGQSCLRMTGTYQSGFYALPLAIGAKERIAIASHSYGVESSETVLGAPQGWVTTVSTGDTGLCHVEHGAEQARQTIFYRDTDLDALMSVSSDPGWSERRQKAMVRCGVSPSSEMSSGVPSWASYLTGIYSKVDASSGSGLKGLLAVVPMGNSNSSPYHSQRIQGYGGIKTPLTTKYKLDITSTKAHPVDLPFETYEPISKNTPNQKLSIGMPVAVKSNLVTLSKCGFDEVKTGDRFTSLSNGEQLPVVTPSCPATNFEFTKMRQVIRSPKIPSCHSMSDGTVMLFYGVDSGKFCVSKKDNPVNQTKPCVLAIKSDTNVDNWGSPKYNHQQTQADAAIASEWERPLMLAYDFRFAGSVKLLLDQFLIFGYGYAQNSSGESMDGKRPYLFIGCYLVSLSGIKSGATHKCYSTVGGSIPTEEQSMFYFRPNKAQASSPMYEMKFGQPIKGVPVASTPTTDTTDTSPERFTKIIGGADSGAVLNNFDLSQEVVATIMSEDGTLSIYLRDTTTDQIIRIWSCGVGGSWNFETDSDGYLIAYAFGSSPTAYKRLLFYFTGDSLYCKNLSTVTEGVYNTKQEELDKLPVSVVATNVVAHKIAVNTEPNGRVVVFYLNNSGHVCSAYSQTSGSTWSYLQNW